MSILVRFHPGNLTPERYQQVRDKIDAIERSPDGRDYHLCFEAEGGLVVSEIWDSQEKMQAFREKLMPVLEEVGIEMAAEPDLFDVHQIEKR